MFSGKYETTHGNTIYGNLVFHMYLIWKMHVYKDHPMFYLLKLAVLKRLFTKSFSGDDNLLGYPTIMRVLFNICAEDYYEFAAQCGLTKKYVRKVVLVGRAEFVSSGKSFFREDKTNFVDSAVFLKCAIKDIYETEKGGIELIYRGRYMYRPTEDIIFRLCNSDKANGYIESFFAKVLSLMYLSVGNIEAYTILVTVFYMARSVFRWRGTFDKQKILEYLGTRTNSEEMDDVFDFVGDREVVRPPTLEEIRAKYNRLTPITTRPLIGFNDMYKYKVKGLSDFGYF